MTLAKKFALYSLLLIFFTGIGTWLVVQRAVRDQIFTEYMLDARASRNIVKRYLQPSDFSPGSTRLADGDFHNFLKTLTTSRFVFIKIWSRDGRMLCSNDPAVVHRKEPIGDHLKQALAGNAVAVEITGEEIAHGTDFKGQKDTSYLEIYTPIKLDGRVVGAFEIYGDLTHVYAKTEELNTQAMALLSGSLVLLWMLLSGVVRRASATIDKQNVGREFAMEKSTSLTELQANYLGTLRSLAAAVEARCAYTSGHSRRTRYLSLKAGMALGLSSEQLDRLGPAAALHDIGKIGTPEAILEKPGPLTAGEWQIMKEHTVTGSQIVAAVPFLADLAPIVRGHHENYDGSGYPDGLAGESIPIEARVLKVADAFDALTSDRPHRSGISMKTALLRLEQGAGLRFDPAVVEVFLNLCLTGGEGEIGRLYGPEFAHPRLISVKAKSRLSLQS